MKNSFKKLTNEHGAGYAIAIYAVAIAFLLVLLVGLLALEAWAAMLLWNSILPALFTFVGPITYWQMVGLQFLIALLVPINWGRTFGSVGKD
jgi:hypothetical protein